MKVRIVDELLQGEKRLIDAVESSNGAPDSGKFPILDAQGKLDPSLIYPDGTIVLKNVPCEPTVYVGAVVIMKSNEEAKNAIATSKLTSNAIGIVEFKLDATTCNIRVNGVSQAIFSGLDVTKEYFLSDTIEGAITTLPPTASGHILLVIGKPFSSDKLLVNIGNRIERA